MSIEGIPWHQVSTEEVLDLHAKEMLRSNGRQDPPKQGCVEGSVGGAYNAVLYNEGDDGPDLLLAAAYILFYLTKNHCFTDGNKRIGWATMVHLFFVNGLRIKAPEKEAADLVESVANSTEGSDETVTRIISWLTSPGRLESI